MSENKYRIDNVRLSFPKLFEPEASPLSQGKRSWSARVLIPKTEEGKKQHEDLTNIMKACVQDAKERVFGGKIPPNMENPIKDGDALPEEKLESSPELRGHWYISVRKNEMRKDKSGTERKNSAPIVVDAAVRRATEDDVYSGVMANVIVDAYAYNRGNAGVNFGLGNVQVLGHGERLGGGGGGNPENEFDVQPGAKAATEDFSASTSEVDDLFAS